MVVGLPVAARLMTRVLVVDDEAPIRRAMAANLSARGYDVDLAETGEQALELAARHHPDVVLLDLGLPGMDGLTVIDGLRGWTQVPIVVLSARGSERGQGRRARRRRRRLRVQAVRDGRAAGPAARGRAAGDAGPTTRRRSRTDDFTVDLGRQAGARRRRRASST